MRKNPVRTREPRLWTVWTSGRLRPTLVVAYSELEACEEASHRHDGASVINCRIVSDPLIIAASVQ